MDLVLYTLRSIAYAIVEPSLAFILISLGLISYIKNKKIAIMQRMILGESINSPLELTLSQMVLGIIAGAIGSLILSHLGVIFSSPNGIILIFFISIMFMLFKPRFACFSYSGAILGLISIISSIIFTYAGETSPIQIDIMSLVVVVGVLHMMEGFLIMFDGSRGAVPVFSNREGKILGGFALNRLWVVPIAIFIVVASNSTGGGGNVDTPSWWPIIGTEQNLMLIQTAVLSLVPNFAGLSYSSVTFSKTKRQKAIWSGLYVLIFGLVLTLASQICRFGVIGELLIVLFMPLGHEIMIYMQRRAENKGNPIYVSDDEGISVLEVIPYTPAYDAGIRSGDKITSINGNSIENEIEVYNLIKESYMPIEFQVKKYDGNSIKYSIQPDKKRRIGVVLVPKIIKSRDTIKFDSSKFKEILDEMKNKSEKKDD